MSQVMTGDGRRFTAALGGSDLRGRIGWICHGLRVAAVIWVGWILVMVVVFWSDQAAVLAAYGRALALDLSGVSTTRYGFALALVFVSWGTAAIVGVCIWRLFGTYLAGQVFTVEAAIWLRRTGIAGVVAVLVSVLARLAIAIIFAGHLVLVPTRLFIVPQDLLHLIFSVFVLALAHIFKAAAEMAEDHAQIV